MAIKVGDRVCIINPNSVSEGEVREVKAVHVVKDVKAAGNGHRIVEGTYSKTGKRREYPPIKDGAHVYELEGDAHGVLWRNEEIRKV